MENWVVLGMTRFTVLGREGEEYIYEKVRDRVEIEKERERERENANKLAIE